MMMMMTGDVGCASASIRLAAIYVFIFLFFLSLFLPFFFACFSLDLFTCFLGIVRQKLNLSSPRCSFMHHDPFKRMKESLLSFIFYFYYSTALPSVDWHKLITLSSSSSYLDSSYDDDC